MADRLLTDQGEVTRIAEEFNSLPKASGAYACPVDLGSAILTSFTYAAGPPDLVRTELTGCRFASNGHVAGMAGTGGGALIDQLEVLVHAPSARGKVPRTAVIAGFIRRFRLRVPPGRHAVELLAHGPRVHDRLPQTRGTPARANHTSRVGFEFDVP